MTRAQRKTKQALDKTYRTVPHDRIEQFCREYRQTFSATKAATACGYADPSNTGRQLLTDPRVQAILTQQALDDRATSSVRIGEVIEALREIAFLDPGELFEESVNAATGEIRGLRLKDILDLPKSVRRAIASIKVIKKNLIAGDGATDDLYEVKFWNKNDALDALGRHVGLATVTIEHVLTTKQVEQLPDTDLATEHAKLLAQWTSHVEARERLRLAAKAVPEAKGA